MPANIDIWPACSHNAAINEMLKFSVGLIPFKQTSLTASVDPIKYYEYRALGLPVVSTCFGEMNYHCSDEGVFIMDETSDTQRVMECALTYQSDANDLRLFREKNSWHARFDSLGLFD